MNYVGSLLTMEMKRCLMIKSEINECKVAIPTQMFSKVTWHYTILDDNSPQIFSRISHSVLDLLVHSYHMSYYYLYCSTTLLAYTSSNFCDEKTSEYEWKKNQMKLGSS